MAERVAKSLTYQRIHHELRDAILSGEYGPGDRFPTEREIGARFGVSRITANKILHGLVAEKLVEYRHGVGTFVCSATGESQVAQQASLTAFCRANDQLLTSSVQEFQVISSGEIPDWAAQDLALTGPSRITRLERLRHINGEPALHETAFILNALIPRFSATEASESLLGYVNSRGLTIQQVSVRVRPSVTTKPIAKSLKLEHPTALLAIRRILYLDDTSPIATVQQLWHPERIRITSTHHIFDVEPDGLEIKLIP
jgi:DNA-binding GntR family transcriptional regulator